MPSEIGVKVLLAGVIFIVLCMIGFNDTIREEVKSLIAYTPRNAVCIINGRDIDNGIITFSEDIINKQTIINIKISEIPTGVYAVHIHENGNKQYSGTHYNPHYSQHGNLNSGHVGDLGNITVLNGATNQKILSKDIKLNGPYAVYGRLFVIRDAADDFESGTAGEILASGIIGHIDNIAQF